MSTFFLCMGVFALGSLALSATLFNVQGVGKDRMTAIVCAIVGTGLASILTGLLALLLGA
jgi:uncharacterized membrane protein